MKIIKKLEEKRRLNFEYKKDIENVRSMGDMFHPQ